MKSRLFPRVVLGLVLITLLVAAANVIANPKKTPKPTVCSNPHPEKLCTAANTCGSKDSPCVLEIKRTGEGEDASITPNIPGFPKHSVICINPGTTVNWTGSGKNTGFMVDFSGNSPFEASTIMGGSDNPKTSVAKKTGCFKYSVGACYAGALNGMCGNSDYDLIVPPATN